MSGESAERSDADGQDVEDDASPSPSVQEPPRPPNEVTARQDMRRRRSHPDAIGASTETVPGESELGTDTPGDGELAGDGSDSPVDDGEWPEGGDDWTAGVVAEGDPQVGEDLLPDHSFALCLTHDVDRPYKLAQAFFYALRDRDPSQLASLLPGRRPNWTFDRIRQIEAEFGVRSAFYFLDEQRLFRERPVREWIDLDAWRLYADRYDLDDPAIVELLHRLDRGGWEVGLHGSYESYDDRGRLRAEKEHLEEVLGKPIRGGRQHYLNRTLPETWEHHAAIGQAYDATLGSSSEIGFDYGDTVCRPFDDEFVAFPLTMMDVAMPDPGSDPAEAWAAADRVLEAAADRGAVTTVLWHPRVFNERDWPGHTDLYRHLIEYAQSLGGWVGSPGELYDELDGPE